MTEDKEEANVDPNEEVITAAHLFAAHSFNCKVCSVDGYECCEKGLRLLKQFHEALNATLRRPNA